MQLGLWIDLPKRMFLTPDFFDWFSKKLGFDLVAVMIDESDRDPTFKYAPKDVEKMLKLAAPAGVEVVLTTWPYPDKELLEAQSRQMEELLAVAPGVGTHTAGVSGWETDQEFNWRPSMVSGFRGTKRNGVVITPYDAAGDYLINVKSDLCAKYGCRNEITTFTEHLENGRQADVAPFADRLNVQAYSVAERDGRPVPYGHRYGPRKMQRLTLERTLTVPGVRAGKPELGVGLAAWSQQGWVVDGKKLRPEDAMMEAFDEAMHFNPVVDLWWSAKFAYPRSAMFNTYAEKFLRGARRNI